jgi:hypothetical protein
MIQSEDDDESQDELPGEGTVTKVTKTAQTMPKLEVFLQCRR